MVWTREAEEVCSGRGRLKRSWKCEDGGSHVRQRIGTSLGVYTAVRGAAGGDRTWRRGSVTSDYHWRWKWRRVPGIITAEGGNWLWRLATGGLAKFSSWCTKYVG